MIAFNSGTAPSFEHPLEMLHACHGKILQQCDTLEKLSAYLDEHNCNEAAQQAAQGILRYFDTAGKFHHQDEELDLFPVLRVKAEPDRLKIDALLNRLLSEHIEMMSAWDELRIALLDIAGGRNTLLPKPMLYRFIDIHRSHIACEESELLPWAARLLESQQITELGTSMSMRRGVKPS